MNKKAPKKKGRGRPALPPEDVKKVFPLRLSETEKLQFDDAARSVGKPLREWILDTLKEGTVIPRVTRRALAEADLDRPSR